VPPPTATASLERSPLTPPQALSRGDGVRVCHLTSVHPPYDTRIFEKECLSLATAGYDVHLVAPAAESKRVRNITLHAVPPARNRFERASVTTARVLIQALRVRARLYHLHDPELIPVGMVLRALGKKVIYDAHEDVPADILDKHYLPRWTRTTLARIVDVGERVAARWLSQVVAATPAIARRFPTQRRALVQNFPALTELVPASEATYEGRGPVVVYVGLIQEIRAVLEMVRAIGKVAARQPVRFILGGRFDTPALEARVRALAAWQHVDYRGVLPRASVAPAFAEARLGLVLFHPTANHVESQPNKLFEYLAAGLPVVASHFPLWRQIIEGAQCGIVVDPRDPDAIASAIGWLLEHPAEAEAMGARGRELVRERLNWSREEATLLECYARILCDS
jgi:glycosyltransferase involved in cell wall biosynthesis